MNTTRKDRVKLDHTKIRERQNQKQKQNELSKEAEEKINSLCDEMCEMIKRGEDIDGIRREIDNLTIKELSKNHSYRFDSEIEINKPI